MHAMIWIATGLIAGWMAGFLMKGRDFGVAGNVLLGLLGGLVGGWTMRLSGFADPHDWLRHMVVSLFGAMLVLGVARRLRPVARQVRSAIEEGASIGAVGGHLQRLGEFEKRVLERLRGRPVRTKDTNAMFDEQLTMGDRVADAVARFGGSWGFIGAFLLGMLCWMIWNTESARRFDAYPFILLNLVLSCVAALQAPIIMMSQNRQAAKDRLDARSDFEVNVRAEMEINHLHAKLDELREREWAELAELARRQLELVEALHRLMAHRPPGEA